MCVLEVGPWPVGAYQGSSDIVCILAHLKARQRGCPLFHGPKSDEFNGHLVCCLTDDDTSSIRLERYYG